jgi:hypothetical protein
MSARRGVGILEVLIALFVIVVAALPLIRSGSSIHTRTYFAEYQVMAALRARTVLSVASAVDFDRLHRALGGAPGGALAPLDLDGFVDSAKLALLFAAPAQVNPLYLEKVKRVTHKLSGRAIDRDRIELRVVVEWSIPAETRAAPHEVVLATLLYRPEASLATEVPLK